MPHLSTARAVFASALALIAWTAAPAAAADVRRVALALDRAPGDDAARAQMVQAAALTLLGLTAHRENGLLKFTVVPPGRGKRTISSQNLDTGFARIIDWGREGGRRGDDAQLAAAAEWVGEGGLVVHIGPSAQAGERRLALRVGGAAKRDVLAAVGQALEDVWADDDRVMIKGPATSIRAPVGVAQQTVLSLDAVQPKGTDQALFEWERDGDPPARAWYAVAPGLSGISAASPVLAVMTNVEVRVDRCPAIGDDSLSYTVWPPGVAEGRLQFRFAGPTLPAPLTLTGQGGQIRLAEPVLGAFSISPRLLRAAEGQAGQELRAGPTLDCRVWPEIVATPRMDAIIDGDGGELQVAFTDAAGATVKAAEVLSAGPIDVLVDRGDADDVETLALTARGDFAIAQMPDRSGETLRMRIDPQRSERRLLGSAAVVVPPTGSGGSASPWLVGLLMALLVGAIGAAWPHASGWLIARLPSARVISGELSVRLRGVIVNQLHIDDDTLFPALAAGMHPVPLGGEADAPALVRLELVRGLRGVRLVAYISAKGVVRTRSRALDRMPWTIGDMSVDLRA